jgi:CRP-like cAMP-binding protein
VTDYLESGAQIVHLTEGDPIFTPSESDDFSYVLLDGLVRLECRDHRSRPAAIQLLGAGRLFGVSWLPSRRRREIGAVAHTDGIAALISRQAMAQAFAALRDRTSVMSYQWRALSGLLVQKREARSLATPARVLHTIRSLAPEFGRAAGDGIRLAIPLPLDRLAPLAGTAADTVRHAVAGLLHEKVLARDADGHFVLPPAPPALAPAPPSAPYAGVPAPWARPALRDLVGRCSHLGLGVRAMDLISRSARLFEVPEGALLLPPGVGDGVGFVVQGSAWLEAAGAAGTEHAIQLVPPGRFVRLPTGPSSRGARIQARAHQACTIGFLTVDEMRAVVETLSVEGALTLLDVTCRGFSRHLCDCTTAPSRATPCRLLATFGFLAHDFPGRADAGVSIQVPLTHDDLARFEDVERPTVTHAIGELTTGRWIDEAGPRRYVLLRTPPAGATGPCPLCHPAA